MAKDMSNTNTLVVDVGNTSTSIGVYRGGAVKAATRIDSTDWDQKKIHHALQKILPELIDLRRVVGATVVPTLKKKWEEIFREQVGQRPYWISHESELGIPISYPEPATIGPDRLANAVAAASLYGRPVVVADFGTALTFDIVTVRGGYSGGIIAPGLPLMFSYLAEKTALLPHIEPAPVKRMVGKSTEEAMRIGARYGYRGMVREILGNLKKSMQVEDLKVSATGGYAAWVLKGMDFNTVLNPDLTLIGIGMIGELNLG